MKYFIYTLLAVTCISANAQTVNELTPTQFESISINGRSIKAIRATNGDEIAMQNLFGLAQAIDKTGEVPSDGILSRGFIYNGLRIGFSSQVVAKGNFSRFEIINSAPALRVKGTTIRVGDNISKLGDVKINNMTTGGKSIVFTPNDDETVYLSIRFDSKTNLITEIIYYVLT